MSQIKNTILKLIETTKIDTRYNSIFRHYAAQPGYKNLVYHTEEHARAVLNLFEILRKLTNKQFDKKELEYARQAIAYHDIGHSGLPDSIRFTLAEDGIPKYDPDAAQNFCLTLEDVTDNIEVAIVAVFNDDRLSSEQAFCIANYIGATRWPHVEIPTDTRKGFDVELVKMIRDADLLWGLLPGCADRSMLGIPLEQQAVGFIPRAKLDIDKILVGQIQFIKNYEPQSGAGRAFKNAMLTDGCEAWARIALEFMRQEELARIVDGLSDNKALELARATRSAVGEMIAK